MKYSAAPLVVLAAGVAAAQQPQARDLAQVEAAVSKVLDGLKAYDVEIKKYEGGDPANFFAATATMIGIVKDAVAGVEAATPVDGSEAANFKPLSDSMNAAGDAVLTDLEAKVDTFSKFHLCQPAYEEITELGNNVVTLMNDVASKFPSPDASKDEIAHFTTTFADIEAKLKACATNSDVKASDDDDCPTGGAGVYPSTLVTSVPTSLPTGGYTAHPSVWTPGPAAVSVSGTGVPAYVAPTKVYNATSPPTSKPTFVTAGAAGLKLSVGAVAVAAVAAFFL